jgi:hypothetical protein
MLDVGIDYPIERVVQVTSVDKVAVRAIGQVYELKGHGTWTAGSVPDYALVTVSLNGILKEMGYPAEKILPILTFFIDELIRVGEVYAKATRKTALPVSLVQVCDNKYVSLVEGPGAKRIFDLTTGSEATQIPSPVVVLSVVLPKLYWLAVAALSAPPGPHFSEAGVQSIQELKPA